MKPRILLIGFCLLGMISLMAQNTQSSKKDSVLKIKKVNDFEVTGTGSASEWKSTEWTSLTKRKGNAEYKTQFKTVYSLTGVYCLFLCEDEKITSTIREDFADIYNEDVVEVFFWTDESSPVYFEYELSPYNFELPIIVPNYQGKFFGWLPWHYEGERKTRRAAKINEENGTVKSWTAEFFIPFALLRPLQNVPPQKGIRWRANFYRLDYDKGQTSFTWQPVRTSFHDYQKYGVIEFE
jgi:Carbohydrate family 9 binding domain-like